MIEQNDLFEKAMLQICLHTGPATPYANGVLSRPLVDAIQALRYAATYTGVAIATDWTYEIERVSSEQPDGAYAVFAVSREGLRYRYHREFALIEQATEFTGQLPGGAVYQPSLRRGWIFDTRYDSDFFRTFDEDGPYAFFEAAPAEALEEGGKISESLVAKKLEDE